jgi:hypothetical protein
VNVRGSRVERSKVWEETPGEHEETLERALRQRARHRDRSVVLRAAVVALGGTIGVFAGLLAVVAPEFGLPLLLLGFRLLALEFDWAARAYARAARLARGVGGASEVASPLQARCRFDGSGRGCGGRSPAHRGGASVNGHGRRHGFTRRTKSSTKGNNSHG